MFESGFHRWAFFYFVACVGVWFYAFNEWWGLIAAIILCVPVGFVFCLLPAMLGGTLRQLHVGDAILTWSMMVAGIALGVYGLIAHDRVSLALILLSGAGLVLAGVQLLQLRINAMRHRRDAGVLGAEDVDFLDALDEARDG